MIKSEKKANRKEKIALCIVFAIILFYTAFHVASLFSPEVSTIVVSGVTEISTVEFDGYVFRDETVLYATAGGAVDYAVKDGGRVLAGTLLANVYESGNRENIRESIHTVDRRMAVLDSALSANNSLAQLNGVKDDLNAEFDRVAERLAHGDVGGLSAQTDAILTDLCRVSLMTDASSPVSATKESLVAKRSELMGAGGDVQGVYAPQSGYFYTGADGYESVFTLQALEGITSERFADMVASEPVLQTDQGYAMGKMAYSSEWRLGAAVTQSVADQLEEQTEYLASFMGNAASELPLFLEQKVESENGAILIFRCDRLPEGFDFARSQSVEIRTESTSGIHVPKSAVHRADNSYYVYILRGGVVLERKIEIVYRGGDYYLVRDNVSYEGSDDLYLKSNDQLIISGSNLFDGRILK